MKKRIFALIILILNITFIFSQNYNTIDSADYSKRKLFIESYNIDSEILWHRVLESLVDDIVRIREMFD